VSGALIVHKAGLGVTLQDLGRRGYLSFGLSRGGAVDLRALAEGAALLGQGEDCAALEMAGFGGEFEVTADTRIALTGAPMRASIDGAALAWNASHLLPKGARLVIGPTLKGVYGYLHLGGGVAGATSLGSRSVHLTAGLGEAISAGMRLALGADGKVADTGLCLAQDARFDGGVLRVVAGPQTEQFHEAEIARFQQTTFTRDRRANRMGVRVLPEGEGFQSEAGLSVLSEAIVPGDIQITGDGAPFVLLAECQTTGGYPRIGSVLPCDLPRVAQAPVGAKFTFRFVSLDDAIAIERTEAQLRRGLKGQLGRLVRNPQDMRDLLAYDLISGVTAGTEED